MAAKPWTQSLSTAAAARLAHRTGLTGWHLVHPLGVPPGSQTRGHLLSTFPSLLWPFHQQVLPSDPQAPMSPLLLPCSHNPCLPGHPQKHQQNLVNTAAHFPPTAKAVPVQHPPEVVGAACAPVPALDSPARPSLCQRWVCPASHPSPHEAPVWCQASSLLLWVLPGLDPHVPLQHRPRRPLSVPSSLPLLSCPVVSPLCAPCIRHRLLVWHWSVASSAPSPHSSIPGWDPPTVPLWPRLPAPGQACSVWWNRAPASSAWVGEGLLGAGPQGFQSEDQRRGGPGRCPAALTSSSSSWRSLLLPVLSTRPAAGPGLAGVTSAWPLPLSAHSILGCNAQVQGLSLFLCLQIVPRCSLCNSRGRGLSKNAE